MGLGTKAALICKVHEGQCRFLWCIMLHIQKSATATQRLDLAQLLLSDMRKKTTDGTQTQCPHSYLHRQHHGYSVSPAQIIPRQQLGRTDRLATTWSQSLTPWLWVNGSWVLHIDGVELRHTNSAPQVIHGLCPRMSRWYTVILP